MASSDSDSDEIVPATRNGNTTMAQLGGGDSSSDDDMTTNLAAWKTANKQTPAPPRAAVVSRSLSPTSSEQVSEPSSDSEEIGETIRVNSFVAVNEREGPAEDNVAIYIPPYEGGDLGDFEDYTHLGEIVKKVLQQHKVQGGAPICEVLFEDTHISELPLSTVLKLKGGKEAYEAYKSSFKDIDNDFANESDLEMSSTRPASKRQLSNVYASTSDLDVALASSDDDDNNRAAKRPRLRLHASRPIDRDGSEDEAFGRMSSRRITRRSASALDGRRDMRTRRSLRNAADSEEEASTPGESSEDEAGFLTSDIKPKRPSRATVMRKRSSYTAEDGLVYDRAPKAKTVRQSGRSTRHQGGMEEIGEDQIHRSDSDRPVAAPKAVGAKEKFHPLPRTDPFRNRHIQQCDTCGQDSNFAPLIYCQGCTFAYHKSCIRDRATREHIATKIGHEDFILQCRRCIRVVLKKEPTAPDQAQCADCKIPGPACKAFRARKTTAQEQKDREANGGEDPSYNLPHSLINNPANVMFRCVTCYRAWHFEHLPPRNSDLMVTDEDSVATQRFVEYSKDWRCQECETAPAKVKGLIAWKPVEEDNYDPTKTIEEINEDDKVYLVKWEGLSYFKASWMPGPWVWGVTAGMMRKSFAKRDEARVPKMTTEDAIPEEYLRTDIVLDVKYTSIVDVKGEEIDKARIREVKQALIKFKGLTYEESVWETPPLPEDEERWTDFVTAYNDYVMGQYIHLPKAQPLKSRLEKVRSKDFATELEKKKQPEILVGGELMKYQLEGLNWLYYKWYSQKNAILADEMGLGKTIQIIAFLATLVSEHNTFPFLVVVPNATCANWRREIKHWAPSLKVVAWFGLQAARDMSSRYELFPKGAKELKAHIVVTSYDAAADEGNKRFFRNVPWQALIVDEGQRLKSDKTILYNALLSLKVPFRILLTGTPLQNNARELFNLLQFLDENHNAAQLEAEYENLDNEKVAKLHDMIRPFFLRRTKAQVLTFLPPMAQIIVPVSMSLVQKKLYRSILAKNPDLLRALFKEKRDLKGSEKGSLNNILMQLRKCLCHPFVYNKGIEERNVAGSTSHRNLVEASGKLQLLELLLPKLKERGHRVLIFSQLLDMLTMVEDFLDGLGMLYHRLDGTLSSLQKQKRIDEFNAPESEYFAFLLSTRAGGVGINLATADTVIILDPDFNPHQDIQALSRAHRIGQKKKVLCFQLVTRASAEEKIVQIGRKKMALDHVLIEKMDAEDASDQDLQSILAYGAAEIFSDDGEKDIKYEDAVIDKLLDRSQIENTQTGEDKSAETQFSSARVWANDGLEDAPIAEAEDTAPDPGVWDKILKERERAAAAEAAAAKEAFGRGRRAKQTVSYQPTEQEVQDAAVEIEESATFKKMKDDNGSDTDFQAESDVDEARDTEPEPDAVNANELGDGGSKKKKTTPKIGQGKKKLFFKANFKNKKEEFAACVKATKSKAKARAKTVAKHTTPKRTPPKTVSKAVPAKPAAPGRRGRLAAVTERVKAPSTPKRSRQGKGALPTPAPSAADTGTESEGPGPTPASKMKEPGPATPSTPQMTAVIDLTESTVFRRVNVPSTFGRSYHGLPTPPGSEAAPIYIPPSHTLGTNQPVMTTCVACEDIHALGSCPLKKAGVERCNLCGLAHFGHARICPHINSETQVRAMLDALKQSPEQGPLVREARKYLTGVKGTLVQKKKLEEEKRRREREGLFVAQLGQGITAPQGNGVVQHQSIPVQQVQQPPMSFGVQARSMVSGQNRIRPGGQQMVLTRYGTWEPVNARDAQGRPPGEWERFPGGIHYV
ncbi:Chromatin remodeling factor mit1-like protein [Elsinoe fawcettii]|nr:Chromatin remodeling factor mit1-like protein [Elsinoe fawcettii]